MTNFEKVGLFMKTFGQEVKTSTGLSTEKINSLRISLINEELEELKKAIYDKNIVEVADALTDILYVAYGAGHAFGIDLSSSWLSCFMEAKVKLSLYPWLKPHPSRKSITIQVDTKLDWEPIKERKYNYCENSPRKSFIF